MANYRQQKQGCQQWTVPGRCSLFHPLLLATSQEYNHHLHPCVFFIFTWLEDELHQPPKLYIWLIRDLTSYRTFKVLVCSAELVDGSAVGQSVLGPGTSQRIWEDAERACWTEVQKHNLKKPERLLSNHSLLQRGTDTCHSGFSSSSYSGKQILGVLTLKKKRKEKSKDWQLGTKKGRYLTYYMNVGFLFITSVRVFYLNICMKKSLQSLGNVTKYAKTRIFLLYIIGKG